MLVIDDDIQAVQEADGFRQGEFGLVQCVFSRVDLVIFGSDEVRFGQVAVYKPMKTE